jgi:hypothetical protein
VPLPRTTSYSTQLLAGTDWVSFEFGRRRGSRRAWSLVPVGRSARGRFRAAPRAHGRTMPGSISRWRRCWDRPHGFHGFFKAGINLVEFVVRIAQPDCVAVRAGHLPSSVGGPTERVATMRARREDEMRWRIQGACRDISEPRGAGFLRREIHLLSRKRKNILDCQFSSAFAHGQDPYRSLFASTTRVLEGW